jgi:hypothetical protein
LAPEELQVIVSAYMSHVGYRQASEDPGLPNDIRSQALSGILGAQERALGLLRARVFTEEEAQRMERAQQGDLTDLAHDDHGKTGANDGG